MIERHCKVICPNCGARWDCSDVTIWVGDSQSELVARACRPSDHARLSSRWPAAPTPEEFREDALGAWLLLRGAQPLGYTTLFPVPGLPHVFELHGEVEASAYHDGGARLLLDTLLKDLDPDRVRQLSYAVDSLQDEDARFLRDYGFRLEHEEWRMRCDLPPRQAVPALPRGYRLDLLHRQQSIDAFLRLYEESFSATPWHQPYSRHEVTSELQGNHSLLFLLYEDAPVGFAWLREHATEGEIEPIGLAPAHQRRGLGRALLLAALWHLAERGLTRARVGVWRQNEAAIHLYQDTGFRRASRRFYLAFDL